MPRGRNRPQTPRPPAAAMTRSRANSPEVGAQPATIFVQPDPADIEPFATTTGPQMPFHARTAWTRTRGQLAIVLAVALLAGMLVGSQWQVLTVPSQGTVDWHYWRLQGVLRGRGSEGGSGGKQ